MRRLPRLIRPAGYTQLQVGRIRRSRRIRQNNAKADYPALTALPFSNFRTHNRFGFNAASVLASIGIGSSLICAARISAHSGADNYIPNIGSVLAAIPPIAQVLVFNGFYEALLVLAGYLLINLVFGNILEPRIMGRGLGLSTLVVFLSLIFWGWLLGPVGMLLSVPLTIIVKIALEQKVLSPAPDVRHIVARSPADVAAPQYP